MPKRFLNNKPFVGLWLILSLALIIFVVYSFSNGITLFDHKLKEGLFKEMLTKNPDNDLLLADTVLPDSVASKITEKGDTTIKTVLIFGDSMTDLVARRLAAYGEQNGFRVISITWDSSTMGRWYSDTKLDDAIAKYHPDFFFVCVGSNEIFARNFDAKAESVRNLVSKFGDKPFVWIGPPNWKKDEGFNPMMLKTLPKGTYFVSDGIQLPRRDDHIHPTREGGVIWTDSLMRWMPKSRHPIPFERPDTSIKSVNYTYLYYKSSGELAAHSNDNGLTVPVQQQAAKSASNTQTNTAGQNAPKPAETAKTSSQPTQAKKDASAPKEQSKPKEPSKPKESSAAKDQQKSSGSEKPKSETEHKPAKEPDSPPPAPAAPEN